MIIKIAESQFEREAALEVRKKVFVEEQNISIHDEIDEFDKTAIHLIGIYRDKVVCASRLRFVDDYGKLERLAVLKEKRGKHYGIKLIRTMEEIIRTHGLNIARLNAQTYAVPFYEKLAYKVNSKTFFDAGIEHIEMIKRI